MLKFLANWRAKRRYVWKELFEAGIAELSAKAALKRAADTRDLVARMTKDADDIEARIKEVTTMEENGFWMCEAGHESPLEYEEGSTIDTLTQTCECGAPAKLIKRETMTGQEKYESDKQRKEVETILANKRAEITAQESEIENQENTAKVFMKQANRGREFADLLRKL